MLLDNDFEFHVDNNDVVRWNTNNQVPFDDMLTKFVAAGLINQEHLLRSTTAREAETYEGLKAYVAMREKVGYSDEEMFEMQAAFGDEEVFDVITGKLVAYNL